MVSRHSARFYTKWLAQIMLYVTAGHEQAGAVEVETSMCWNQKKMQMKKGHILGKITYQVW